MSKVTPVTTGSGDDWKWKVESAANTLMESEKIKTDPKLLAAAQAELRRRSTEIRGALGKLKSALVHGGRRPVRSLKGLAE